MLHILHAADLHLDSPFSGLSPEQAAARRSLQRQLPDQIVDLANARHCDLLLLAGDVFDGSRVCPETIEAMQTAFARCNARIFIAPGNHDPYHDQSPWAVCRWPEQVHIFTGAQDCVSLPELGCRVWGAAFPSAVCHDVLEPVTSQGLVEIGVYHGDPEHPGSYQHLSPADLDRCGLDYLALGHIHKPSLPKKAGAVWYGWPGAAMGRGFDETGVHGVFHVKLDAGRCETEFLPLSGPRYEILTVPAGQSPQLPPDSEQVICRMILTGETEPPDLETLHQQLSPRFLSLELRDATTPPQSLWAACGDETLRGKALEILKHRYDTEQGEARQTAALAARLVLAALEGRELP